MMMIAILLMAIAAGAALYAVLSQVDERVVVRESLRQLDGYEVENQRDQELLDPLKDRAIKPLLETMSGLGRRFTPVGYVDKVKQKFIYAGETSPQAVDRFLALRVASIIGAVVAFFAIMVLGLGPFEGVMRTAVGGLLIAACLLGPDSILNRKVEERQLEIERSLPDILDLLTISVEAGLGFDQAVDRVISSVPGPLSDEFSRMLGETRAGASRADAMRALDERCGVPDLRAFIMAVIQADAFGISIGRVLRGQADEMRIKRRQRAQEKAQKAPVKMLIPMVFCIFPSIFVVILGPAMISIMESL